MGIHYLDGRRLRRALIAAAQAVLAAQEHLNAISVFPVPDGDTGTNMALTLKHLADAAVEAPPTGLSELTDILADAALTSARGNSGAVLAQFFQGLAHGVQGAQRVGPRAFARAAANAADHAASAVADPREGTVLTVMRVWAASLSKDPKQTDFVQLWTHALADATQALAETPDQLAALAEAGVVDAGARGFVAMLEGVAHLIETGESLGPPPSDAVEKPRPLLAEAAAALTFRFCTECLIEGKNLDQQAIRTRVTELGDSLIVAGSGEKVKLHIHTDDPERLFQVARGFGRLAHTKAEDMQAQNRHMVAGRASIALFTDSSCDLPTDYLIQHHIKMVPVTVTLDERTYQDRLTITSREVYRRMAAGAWPKTSQPAPASFHQTLRGLRHTHQQGLGIFLSSAVSGTHQAACLAAQAYPDMDLRIVDSRTVAGALGLLVRIAAESIEAGFDLDTVERRVLAARRHCKLFASFPTLKHLVRGGRIGRLQGMVAGWLDMVPILSFNAEGGIEAAAKSKSGRRTREKVVALTRAFCRGRKNLRFTVCHADNEDTAAFYAEALGNHFALDHVDVLSISPTIGAHVGLGAACISVYGLPEHEELPS